VSWSEFNEQFLLAGCGSGLVIFWNLQKGKMWSLETKNEVQSVEFNPKNPLFLATSSLLVIKT
jgi:WD40 repeat protein